jgi:uncharacterized protein (TIGR00369 family)
MALQNGAMPNLSSDASSILDQWLAAEAALRETASRGPGVGAIPMEMAAGRDGLALLHAMLSGEAPTAPIGHAMDFLLVEVDRGRAVFQGAPGARFANPMGGLHGGWYATLLDSALGCSVLTMMPAGRGYTTAELSVNLVRAIPSSVKRVRAEGKVLHCGRQLATAEGRLVGPDGTLYAHGTTTCLVFDVTATKGSQGAR